VLLTTKAAGKRLNLSARAVHFLVEADLIPHTRNEHGLVLILEEGLEKFALTAEEIIESVRTKKNNLEANRPKENDYGRDGNNYN
jgi:hypothetical protein